MDRFDWQSEEDGPIAPAIISESRQSRRSLTTVAIIVCLVAVATVVVWQLGRQAQSKDRAVREDVKAAYGVWRQAVSEQDGELLGTLLMDGEAEWVAIQRRLLATGRSLDRPVVGLAIAGRGLETREPEPQIELNGDWRSAEISFPLAYFATEESSTTREVRLEQTLPLVREGSRWLLRRPEEEFWGIWHTAAGDIASVTYRERDQQFAERLLEDLDRDLKLACAGPLIDDDCPAEARLDVRLESDPASLLKTTDQSTPAFAGSTFVLPAPTLVGIPLDAKGYEVLYHAYTSSIIDIFTASLASPIELPEQELAMLCFSRYGQVPQFYSYDPAKDQWQQRLNDLAFRNMAADDAGDNLALREYLPGEPNRLRLIQWTGDRATLLHDETYGPLTDHTFGWTSANPSSGLLLASFRSTMRRPSYRLLDSEVAALGGCQPAGCGSEALEGFPVWSPDGQQSLVFSEGQIYRVDSTGQIVAALGEGHSPFWLDNRRYGFVRPRASDDRQTHEVVSGFGGVDEIETLWQTGELDPELFEAVVNSPLYIQHVAVVDGRPPRLLLYGRQYAGDQSRYVFLSLPIQGAFRASNEDVLAGPIRLELTLAEAPAGIPSAGDPNGHVPFVISPDGRWLTVAYLTDKEAGEWGIQVVEIGRDKAQRFSTDYPGYSFNHPFFDWSSDGRWLVIVDDAFIKLVAPENGYERIIAHEQRSCMYPSWIDRQADE